MLLVSGTIICYANIMKEKWLITRKSSLLRLDNFGMKIRRLNVAFIKLKIKRADVNSQLLYFLWGDDIMKTMDITETMKL